MALQDVFYGGTTTYNKAQLMEILKTPVKGNGLIPLAYQLIAVKLNIANGSDGSAVSSAIWMPIR
jgi:hypothetical protein